MVPSKKQDLIFAFISFFVAAIIILLVFYKIVLWNGMFLGSIAFSFIGIGLHVVGRNFLETPVINYFYAAGGFCFFVGLILAVASVFDYFVSLL